MRRISLGVVSCLFAGIAMAVPGKAQETWYPFPIDVWQPPFSESQEIVDGIYTPLEKASKQWNICVSFPHMKDAYWLAVNYGILKEAQRLGVRFTMYEAGGYENLNTQIRQINECLESDPDGLILSAVDFDALNDLIAEIEEEGIPVIDLINGVSSDKISARSARPYYDLGYEAGRFLVQHLKDEGWSGSPARVAWFPGPESAGWAHSGNSGFMAAVAGSQIEIVSTLFGDTGRPVQAALMEQAFEEHGTFDFIVGTSVSAEAAVRILRERGLTEQIGVMAYYFSPGVLRGIQRGVVLGAPSDNQAIQGRIAVDQIIRILEGEDIQREVAAKPSFVSRETVNDFDAYWAVPPLGFRPVFVLN